MRKLFFYILSIFFMMSCENNNKYPIDRYTLYKEMSKEITLTENENIALKNTLHYQIEKFDRNISSLVDNFERERVEYNIRLSIVEYDLKIEKEKLKILSCESGFKHDGIWGDNGKSYGIAQFQEKTFNRFKKMSGRTYLQWKSEKDQLWLLDWALHNGYGKYWSCY